MLHTFDPDSLHFYEPQQLQAIGATNANAGSAFSRASRLWYLPFLHSSRSRDILYLKVLNLEEETLSREVRIDFGPGKQFLPANFLHTTRGNRLLFIGIDYLSNTDRLPVRIYSLNESQLLAAVPERKHPLTLSAGTTIGILVVLLALILALIYFGRRRSGDHPKARPFSMADLANYEWLNANEKKLIGRLWKEERFWETHEIEDLLWPHIDNYDYRRRLRNDIIKTINDKVQNHRPVSEKLIIKKADPADRRKNLYGINPTFRT